MDSRNPHTSSPSSYLVPLCAVEIASGMSQGLAELLDSCAMSRVRLSARPLPSRLQKLLFLSLGTVLLALAAVAPLLTLAKPCPAEDTIIDSGGVGSSKSGAWKASGGTPYYDTQRDIPPH